MKLEYVKDYLSKKLGLSDSKINKINIYVKLLLNFNKKYNLISKNSVNDVWNRHILDSAQIIKLLEFKDDEILSDFGTGAGLPGIIISIANNNPRFHVKLYEKSPVKRSFLKEVQKIANFEIEKNIFDYKKIRTDYIVCRAFKKLNNILQISREKVNNPHKVIILKGKNALNELKKLPKGLDYRYKIVNSVTDKESKIIIAEKNEK